MNHPIIGTNADSRKSIREHILCWLNEFEEIFTTLASRLGPWLAPISPAYFVSRAAVDHLHTNLYIAIIMAVALEFVGVSSIHLAVRSWTWNHTKRKTDPSAPLPVGIALASLYFLATITLTVIVEVIHEAVTFAPMIFVILTGVGYFAMALNWRINQWETERKYEIDQRQAEKEELFTTVKAAKETLATTQAELSDLEQQRLTLTAEITALRREQQHLLSRDLIADTDNGSGNTRDQAYRLLLDIYSQGQEITGSALGRKLGVTTGRGRQLKNQLLAEVQAALSPITDNSNDNIIALTNGNQSVNRKEAS